MSTKVHFFIGSYDILLRNIKIQNYFKNEVQ